MRGHLNAPTGLPPQQAAPPIAHWIDYGVSPRAILLWGKEYFLRRKSNRVHTARNLSINQLSYLSSRTMLRIILFFFCGVVAAGDSVS
jgi:hypothetical protein